MKRNPLFEACAAVALAVSFIWISLGGITLGGKKILPASPLTAVAVLGGGVLAAYLLLSIGKSK